MVLPHSSSSILLPLWCIVPSLDHSMKRLLKESQGKNSLDGKKKKKKEMLSNKKDTRCTQFSKNSLCSIIDENTISTLLFYTTQQYLGEDDFSIEAKSSWCTLIIHSLPSFVSVSNNANNSVKILSFASSASGCITTIPPTQKNISQIERERERKRERKRARE